VRAVVAIAGRACASAIADACSGSDRSFTVPSAYLGVCAGVRLQELQGLQGRHFQRPGYIWISADIGTGGRERWIPVLVDLFPLVEDIRQNVTADEYVIPAERWRDRAGTRSRPS
jgi:hypothetical protein